MKRLVFASILIAGCNSPATSDPPKTATAVIPSATTTSAKTNEPPSALPPVTDSACDVPADFPVVDALPKGADTTEILAWRSRVDERPLYVEDALVWQKRTDAGKAVYTLAHVYRHPKDENVFRLSIIYDAPVSAEANYDHPPNGKDMESYLAHSTLSWSADGFKMTAGKVCSATWTRLVGEAPKHEFTP